MTVRKATIKRLATGVPGLDEVLGGGLPEFSLNLIVGPPGSGKTTLAHQIMFALATRKRPALYFTVLGEPPLKMLRYQQQFEFFDSEQVNASVRFINLADDTASGDLDKVLGRIVAEVEAHGPAVVFVDSFRSVMLASQTEGKSFMGLQQFIQQLGMLMTGWQATTFLIGEYVEAEVRDKPLRRGYHRVVTRQEVKAVVRQPHSEPQGDQGIRVACRHVQTTRREPAPSAAQGRSGTNR